MKRSVFVIILFFLLATFYGCSKSGSGKIFGKYSFDKLIYYSGLDSYRPTIDQLSEAKYIIKKDRFEIVRPEGKLEVKNPIYIKEEMNDKLVQEFNDTLIHPVSISKYKEKYRYKIYEKEDKPSGYCLYLLDDELWISSYTPGMKKFGIWYIYKLK